MSGLAQARPHRLPLGRLPLTSATLGALVVVGSVTDTFRGELTRRVLRVWGWAPADFAIGELYRIVSSALVTHGGVAFLTGLVMVLGMVGVTEWRRGTRRAALTFWGGHITTLLVMASVAYLHLRIDPETAEIWSAARDVGPSAGAFSCFGFLAADLPKSRGRALAAGVLSVLLVDAILVPGSTVVETSADLAHLIAFPLGYGSSFLGRRG